jgi:DNA repair exonuclease SbcCD ATPase subunit
MSDFRIPTSSPSKAGPFTPEQKEVRHDSSKTSKEASASNNSQTWPEGKSLNVRRIDKEGLSSYKKGLTQQIKNTEKEQKILENAADSFRENLRGMHTAFNKQHKILQDNAEELQNQIANLNKLNASESLIKNANPDKAQELAEQYEKILKITQNAINLSEKNLNTSKNELTGQLKEMQRMAAHIQEAAEGSIRLGDKIGELKGKLATTQSVQDEFDRPSVEFMPEERKPLSRTTSPEASENSNQLTGNRDNSIQIQDLHVDSSKTSKNTRNQDSIQRLQNELKSNEQALEEALSQIHDLQKQTKDQANALRNLSKEVEEKNKLIEKQNSRIESLRENASSTNISETSLAEELAGSDFDLRDAELQQKDGIIAKLQKQLEAQQSLMEKQSKELSQMRKASQSSAEAANAQLSSISKELISVKDENAKLAANLAKSSDEITHTNSKINDLLEQISENEEALWKNSAELIELIVERDDAVNESNKKEVTRLNQEISQKDKTIENLESQLKQLNKTLESERKNLTTQATQHNTLVKELQAENAALEAQIKIQPKAKGTVETITRYVEVINNHRTTSLLLGAALVVSYLPQILDIFGLRPQRFPNI